MSDYGMMPVSSESPPMSTISDGSNSFYEYHHHYCTPIFSTHHDAIYLHHQNNHSYDIHPSDKINSPYSNSDILHKTHPNVPVPVKRRNTANKKERRRTQSINAAFQDLRDRIPNVPADTKLSKIKTLRLATSYISYLTGVLETDDPAGGFRAEFAGAGVHCSRRSDSRQNKHHNNVDCNAVPRCDETIKCDKTLEERQNYVYESLRKSKGRTGWPQHVWALELKQEQNL